MSYFCRSDLGCLSESSIVLLLIVLISVSVVPASATPSASFVARKIQGSSCVAPCAVHFDAIGTGSNQTSDPDFSREFHSLRFQWNFGDPNQGTWPISGVDKNTAIGGIAGHLYQQPGTYTVTLNVRNPAGEESLATQSVTVTDPSVYFTSANTYCFANDSNNWAGCPLNCAGGNDNCTVTSSWDQLITQADNCIGASDCANADAVPSRILLRRGDTFTQNNFFYFSNNSSPGLIQSFGSGASPVIDTNGYRNNWGRGWTITGIDISEAGQALFVGNGIDNVTFYQINAEYSGSCIEQFNTAGSTDAGELHAFIDVNCTAANTSTGYSTWPGGRYTLWMGGTFNKRGGAHSTLRSTHMQHYLIQHTRWINAAPGREHWQFRAYDEFSNMTPEQEANKYVLLSDNVVENPGSNNFFAVRACVDSGCNCGEGAPNCGGAAIGAGKIVPVKDFIFERNFFSFSNDGLGQRIGIFEIQGGDFTLRNNVVDFQGAMNGSESSFVVMTGEPTQHTSGSTPHGNIHVYNNTIYFTEPISSRFNITNERGSFSGSGCSQGCASRNNLLVGPNFTGQLQDHPNFASSNNAVSRSNPFAAAVPSQGLTTLLNFRLASNSSYINAGYTFSPTINLDGWVYDDAFGSCRGITPNLLWDIGAHEFGATTCFGSNDSLPPASPTQLRIR